MDMCNKQWPYAMPGANCAGRWGECYISGYKLSGQG